MSAAMPRLPLREAAEPVSRPVTLSPGQSYRQLGVSLWGKGAYEREPADGGLSKYQQLFRAERGDIVVNKIWARNGSVAVVDVSLAGCHGSNEFPMFAPIEGRLDPRWMHWVTKTKDFWAQCDQKSQGTSGQNRIKPEQFLDVEIPLPPLDEQRRIVARIEELAAKVEKARWLRRDAAVEIQAARASAANDLFSDEAMAGVPVIALDDISEIRAGVTLGRQLSGKTTRAPYLRVANVQDDRLDLTDLKEVEIYPSELEKWELQNGDLLLTEGGDWDKLGRGTVWQGEIDGCIHQNHIFRVRVDQARFDPWFVSALVSSPRGKKYFQAASKKTTNLASINQRQLKAFPIFQVNLDRQRAIVAELEALQAKVDAVKSLQTQTAAELDAMLPAILDKAFKGEL